MYSYGCGGILGCGLAGAATKNMMLWIKEWAWRIAVGYEILQELLLSKINLFLLSDGTDIHWNCKNGTVGTIDEKCFDTCPRAIGKLFPYIMAIRVVEFLNRGYKIRKIFAQESTYSKEIIEF